MRRAAYWCVAAVVSAAALPRAAQQPAFSARTTMVRVDVSVTQRGRAVTGLTPADFEVRDNGVRQRIEFLAVETMPVSLTLVIDGSDSVAGNRLDHLRRATEQAIGALQPADRAGVISFSHQVTLLAKPTTDHARVKLAIDGSAGSGGTALVDASYAGFLLPGEDTQYRNALIVFSDGVETTSWLTPAAVIDAAARIDVVAYAVTVGGRPRVPFLSDLASATGGSMLEVESTADLGQAFVRILDEFRQRYLLSYRPRGVAEDGRHRLEVRVNSRGATVRARPGYVVNR